MKLEYLEILKCPSKLEIIQGETNVNKIKEGWPKCINIQCQEKYEITNFVPRFVNYSKYADSFVMQWKSFAKTQLDSETSKDSEIRWDSEIGWSESEINGKMAAEFGLGAGRFVDIVSKRGAKLVIGVDITDAVDASQDNLGARDNVFFIQADFFNLSLNDGVFDFAYSIGVLHHTPNPEESFSKMVKTTNSNGKIGVSLYDISFYLRPNRNSLVVSTKELLWAMNLWRCELFRQITTRLPDGLFLFYCKTIVPFLHYLNKIPILGLLRYLLPSTCYKNKPVSWSMVDTHDTYATKIVHQYRHKDIFQWFLKNELYNIIVHNSRAGWISLTGTKNEREKQVFARFIHEQPLALGLEIK